MSEHSVSLTWISSSWQRIELKKSNEFNSSLSFLLIYPLWKKYIIFKKKKKNLVHETRATNYNVSFIFSFILLTQSPRKIYPTFTGHPI